MLAHPNVAFRSCESCKKWLYNEETGKIEQRRVGTTKEQRYVDVPRTTPPPCETAAGCAKGHWRNPKSLNERNQMAYLHYRECRAVGSFPDDAVVRKNASVIHELEEVSERTEQHNLFLQSAGLASLMGRAKK